MTGLIKKAITLPDGREVSLETGLLAKQADGAVILRCGQTVILATVVSSRDINLTVDFLPLSVDYMENFSAAGKFPGGFFKRDGRMGEGEILTSRLVDRALRPLFPEDYHADTQVMIQLLSTDRQDQPDAWACLAASAAICVSDIPFPDPVTEVRIARKDGSFIINPTYADMEACDMDLMVAATDDSINMVEGEMKEISEEVMLDALKQAHQIIRLFNGLQNELRAAVGKVTRDYDKLERNEELYGIIQARTVPVFEEVARSAMGKADRNDRFKALKKTLKQELKEQFGGEKDEYYEVRFNEYYKSIEENTIRGIVLNENLRLDGRKLDEVRPISCLVSFLPRTHGSAIFTRGETQAMCTATLGTKMDEQTVDTATFQGSKRFMLQYNFPGFSTGEVKPNRAPARREIGHGNLAERALKPMVPTDIPYTIRVVSNILESNGSTSMASVCGGTLALMDAGIQLIRPVSGIAMGLISGENGKFAVLSDILGDEDFLGDMDFKVTGTEMGLTACQMDIKIRGLSYEIIETALQQSKAGRMHILGEMLKALPEPRQELSRFAPRFFVLEVPHEFFGAVIGPGGKVIQEIQRSVGVVIALEEGSKDVGTATISGENAEVIEEAARRIRALIQVPEVGEVYKAKVKSLQEYGAFVEYLPGKEGLLHISEIAYERINSVEDVLAVGDEIDVKLVGLDKKTGKYRLSRKVLLPVPEGYVEPEPRQRDFPRDRDRDRGGNRDRGGDRGGDRNFDRNKKRY